MRVLQRVTEVRSAVASARGAGERIAFVPTMGNLHEGHLSLVRRGRSTGGYVIVSIFVNPFQFGEGEDLSTYPRTPEADLARLREESVDLVFQPDVSEIYPAGPEASSRVEVPVLGEILCGASRPGFFRGVATVVTMLLNAVQPDIAVFGEKDYQQLLVVRRLVADLKLPLEVVGAPTIREPDGLAMSSRNAYLTAAERQRAPLLYAALQECANKIAAGKREYPVLAEEGWRRLAEAGFRPDYFTVRRAADLQEPGEGSVDLRILAAGWLGRARLIDNVSAAG